MQSQFAEPIRQIASDRPRRPTSNAEFARGGDRAARPILHNRIPAVMVHVSRYAFEGQARLAADVGVSRSTISRFLRGHTLPSYALVEAVARALSARAGRPLAPRELVSFDGTYPTPSTCALVGCRGCLPEQAYDSHGELLPEWREAKPGDWSRFPETSSPQGVKPEPQRTAVVTSRRMPEPASALLRESTILAEATS